MINTNPVTLHYIHRQRHFSQFIDNYVENTEYLYNNMYCDTLYQYIKYN